MPGLTPERSAALNGGAQATRNLAECLAIDQAALAQAVAAGLGLQPALPRILAVQREVAGKGISHQIAAIGMAIGEALQGLKPAQAEMIARRLQRHPSDMVRSWAAFAFARAASALTLRERLDAARPFAADMHFGVREWAWIAVRPYIAADIGTAVALLQDWTAAPDPNIRRFAVESTRPRGVWCEHIAALKTDPSPALPLLQALRADPARYVQDSVANWLNDASKTAPAWVLALCQRWQAGKNPATHRIIDRALRTLRKQEGHAGGDRPPCQS
jgi:3-methyladenine DNA glycosylase AlkC